MIHKRLYERHASYSHGRWDARTARGQNMLSLGLLGRQCALVAMRQLVSLLEHMMETVVASDIDASLALRSSREAIRPGSLGRSPVTLK